ncbi:hypothetical protein C5B42_00280 [Candidatus Cerribacteria bacterium 'Amazon FNV 2010 28 9']|uniref:Uncharacterized protein n=1 Tax=Candidatus Cerribacteria bacterium 'Amazon FNV 2010 28 9' TaxID=2081795 RepID=A0A317JUD1_9BACT|nr:MAG: hypothetical protein C5B42_00280 [Candidatus Cerribacteria bacterium 'Amazon FNV 2010 28 9']
MPGWWSEQLGNDPEDVQRTEYFQQAKTAGKSLAIGDETSLTLPSSLFSDLQLEVFKNQLNAELAKEEFSIQALRVMDTITVIIKRLKID